MKIIEKSAKMYNYVNVLNSMPTSFLSQVNPVHTETNPVLNRINTSISGVNPVYSEINPVLTEMYESSFH